jgi:hypothetical protein
VSGDIQLPRRPLITFTEPDVTPSQRIVVLARWIVALPLRGAESTILRRPMLVHRQVATPVMLQYPSQRAPHHW